MIVLLNFAPIEFMGGAERWMHKMGSALSEQEEVILVSVSSPLASIYGRLVLGRSFENRTTGTLSKPNLSLIHITFTSLIPWTLGWRKLRKIFKSARVVYVKYELLEVLLNLYFGGFKILNRAVAGLHSAFIYQVKLGFFDYLHGWVYQSRVSMFMLSKFLRIHVLNSRDENYLKSRGLVNVIRIPNSLPLRTDLVKIPSPHLKVVFVGELSVRKGIDIALEVMQFASPEITFYIVGNGPYVSRIEQLTKERPNCIYKKYLNQEEVYKLYSECDALFLPSRGEGFSLVILEALSMGLKIIDAGGISLNMPKDIEYSAENNNVAEYLGILSKLKDSKSRGEDISFQIKEYFQNNYSDRIIMPKIMKEIFAI
jgi:glycosyltransferase involved in cell wall biosynthesis